MNSKKIIKILLLLIFVVFLLNINVKALDINSKNAILYNLNDDEILFEKNSKEKISIASLTKIMTAIVTIENVSDLDETIVFDMNDFKNLGGYALSGYSFGNQATYRDLLYAIMLPSGAEAAQAISNHLTGSNDEFIDLMNSTAKKIGLKNTKFDNPIGRDSINNYSTVEDVSILLKYCLKNKEFQKIFYTKKYTTTNGLKLESTLLLKAKVLNTNVDYIKGSKTGTSQGAGLCLASVAEMSNINYLLVTCNAPYSTTYHYNLEDAINIYKYYDENHCYQKIIKKNQLITILKVKDSFIKELKIYSDKDIEVYMDNKIDVNKLSYEYEGIEIIDYTFKVGEELGTLKVKYDNEIIYSYPVVLKTKIYIFPVKIIVGFLIFIIFIILIKKKRKKKHKRRKIK